MNNKRKAHPAITRTLTSLTAILAVSAIFGAKALEVSQREEAKATAMAQATPANGYQISPRQ